MGYVIREGLHFCIANHKVALLDMREGRYFCLPQKADAAFQKLMLDAVAEPNRDDLAPLISREVIIDRPGQVHQLCPTQAPLPNVEGAGSLPTPHAWDLATAFISHVRTAIAFKRLSAVEQLNALKSKTASSHRKQTPTRQALRALNAFTQTRMWIPSHDRCLYWSIALRNHLSAFGYYPSLVIGIRMTPFHMHAWVQDGGQVLNDTLDQVRPYTPILVV